MRNDARKETRGKKRPGRRKRRKRRSSSIVENGMKEVRVAGGVIDLIKRERERGGWGGGEKEETRDERVSR